MAFELFEKQSVGNMKENEISIRNGHVTFGARKFFQKNYVEIYVNRKRKLVGFLPSNDNIKGFRVRYKGRASPIINHSNPFIRSLMGRYFGKIDEDMFVIKVENLK